MDTNNNMPKYIKELERINSENNICIINNYTSISEYQYRKTIKPFIEWNQKMKTLGNSENLGILIEIDNSNKLSIEINYLGSKLIIPNTLNHIMLGRIGNQTTIQIQDINSLILNTTTIQNIMIAIADNCIKMNKEAYEKILKLQINNLYKIARLIDKLIKTQNTSVFVEAKHNYVKIYDDYMLKYMAELICNYSINIGNIYNKELYMKTKEVANKIYTFINNATDHTIQYIKALINLIENEWKIKVT